MESVVSQTYPEVEYIVVDGGSSDETVEVIKKYQGRIARWISEPDHGMYDAMNKGIAMATGEWIGILNADDWYEPDTVMRIAEASKAYPEAELLHCDLKMWNGARQWVLKGNSCGQIRGCRMTVNHPGSFVKKSLYDRIGGYDTSYRLSADFDFVFRCRDENVKMQYLPQCLVNMSDGGRSKAFVKRGLSETRAIAAKHGIPGWICGIEYYKALWKFYLKQMIGL